MKVFLVEKLKMSFSQSSHSLETKQINKDKTLVFKWQGFIQLESLNLFNGQEQGQTTQYSPIE